MGWGGMEWYVEGDGDGDGAEEKHDESKMDRI